MSLDPLRHPFFCQGTIRGLFASSKSFPLFVLLIFSTSLVGKLSVCNCLEQSFCLGPIGSMWSYLWSPSQVLVLLVSICSFLVLVCREWRWISWTRNHGFHHSLAFSSFIFFMSEQKTLLPSYISKWVKKD